MSDIQGMKSIGSAHCTQYKTEARFYIDTPPDGQRKLVVHYEGGAPEFVARIPDDWSEQQVWDYIKQNNVPYNPLHDQGFPSIGCAPCTRAVAPGEDIRSGRWWWESPEHKECGLHRSPAHRNLQPGNAPGTPTKEKA